MKSPHWFYYVEVSRDLPNFWQIYRELIFSELSTSLGFCILAYYNYPTPPQSVVMLSPFFSFHGQPLHTLPHTHTRTPRIWCFDCLFGGWISMRGNSNTIKSSFPPLLSSSVLKSLLPGSPQTAKFFTVTSGSAL